MNQKIFIVLFSSMFLFSACATPPKLNKRDKEGCVSGNCFNGYGVLNTYLTFEKSSGGSPIRTIYDKYEGNFKGGREHGKGKLTIYGHNWSSIYTMKNVYPREVRIGSWNNGELHGKVKIYEIDKNTTKIINEKNALYVKGKEQKIIIVNRGSSSTLLEDIIDWVADNPVKTAIAGGVAAYALSGNKSNSSNSSYTPSNTPPPQENNKNEVKNKNLNNYHSMKKSGGKVYFTCEKGAKQNIYIKDGNWHTGIWSTRTQVLTWSDTGYKASEYSAHDVAKKQCDY